MKRLVWRNRSKQVFHSFCFPVAFAIVFYYLILLGSFIVKTLSESNPYNFSRDNCTCECYDRQGKAGYFDETFQYKSIYINYDVESAFLIVWTGLYAWAMIKLVQRLWTVAMKRRTCYLVLVAMGWCCHQQIYNWFMIYNYINDRIWWMLPTQYFFVASEWVPCICLFYLLDKRVLLHHNVLVLASAVSLTHVLCSLEDQGFSHLLNGGIQAAIQVRDLSFFIGDCLPLYIFLKKAWPLQFVQSRALLGLTCVLYGLYASIRFIWHGQS